MVNSRTSDDYPRTRKRARQERSDGDWSANTGNSSVEEGHWSADEGNEYIEDSLSQSGDSTIETSSQNGDVKHFPETMDGSLSDHSGSSHKEQKVLKTSDNNVVGQVSLRVKDEPVDHGYGDYVFENDESGSHPQLRRLLCKPVGGQVLDASVIQQLSPGTLASMAAANSSNTSDKQDTVNSVLNLLSSKHELQITREELERQVTLHSQAQWDLKRANAEIAELKEKLGTKESQISTLAANFFSLSDQLLKVSQQFTKVVSELPDHLRTGVVIDRTL